MSVLLGQVFPTRERLPCFLRSKFSAALPCGLGFATPGSGYEYGRQNGPSFGELGSNRSWQSGKTTRHEKNTKNTTVKKTTKLRVGSGSADAFLLAAHFPHFFFFVGKTALALAGRFGDTTAPNWLS
jgi:hypothetical protein